MHNINNNKQNSTSSNPPGCYLVTFVVLLFFIGVFSLSQISVDENSNQRHHQTHLNNPSSSSISGVVLNTNSHNHQQSSSSSSTLGQRSLQHCQSGMLQYSRHFLFDSKHSWFGPKKGTILLPGMKSIQELARTLQLQHQVAPNENEEETKTVREFIHSLNSQTNFKNIFDIEYEVGKLQIPKNMKKQARAMFSKYKTSNNNPEDVSHIETQHVVISTNKITSETSLFNDLRKYRPGALRHITPEEDLEIHNKYLEKEGADKCDFCARNRTALDVFGRITGNHCYTAANIGKLGTWHSLLINNRHHPLKVTKNEVVDWMMVARKWFEKAHELDPAAKYPHIMYDAGSRASASQPHLHLQMMLTKNNYFTNSKNLLDRAYQYSYCENGGSRDYWRDWIKAHEGVGLAVHYDDSWLVVSLTPIHDKEIFVIGNSDKPSFATLLHFAINLYVNSKLQVRSFSMGMFLEKMETRDSLHNNNNNNNNKRNLNEETSDFYPSNQNMPAVARFTDRGAPFDVRSDVGAMEFYGAFNVGTDPYFIMEQVKNVAREEGLVF